MLSGRKIIMKYIFTRIRENILQGKLAHKNVPFYLSLQKDFSHEIHSLNKNLQSLAIVVIVCSFLYVPYVESEVLLKQMSYAFRLLGSKAIQMNASEYTYIKYCNSDCPSVVCRGMQVLFSMTSCFVAYFPLSIHISTINLCLNVPL